MPANNIPAPRLSFPRGDMTFWAQHAIERDYHETNTYDVNPKILAVLLDQVNNLTIDGNGSEFIMHGRMQPFTLDRCQNITLKNFSVDWEIPLTAQGTVTQSTPRPYRSGNRHSPISLHHRKQTAHLCRRRLEKRAVVYHAV